MVTLDCNQFESILMAENSESVPQKIAIPLTLPRKTSLGSAGISFLVHAVVVFALACWFLPVLSFTESKLEGVFTEPEEMDIAQNINVVTLTSDVATGEMRTSLSVSTVSNMDQSAVAETAVQTPKTNVDTVVRLPSAASQAAFSDRDLLAAVEVPMWAMPIHSHRGETRMNSAEDATGISTGIAGQLKSISGDGDATVVWLLDQSISMQKDLQIFGAAIKETLVDIEKNSAHKMTHYVVAFGDDVRLIQDATDKGQAVAKAIYNLPQDPSGVENTFQAIEWAVARLFQNRRWLHRNRQMLLVVWTDESGDDILRLENTIAICRQANVRVDVIGPSAVLGSDQGYSRFVHPANNLAYYLPVTRGPDTAFREKPYFPYWHRSVPRDYDESLRGPFQGTSPQWYGGSDLKSMLSGFSPYAMTRLTRETGGVYTLFDRPGDRAPFTLEALKNYMPDYRSAAEISAENQQFPLRLAVQWTAEMSWREDFSPPIMDFHPSFPGEAPSAFRNELPNRLKQQLAYCQLVLGRIDSCLQKFHGGDIDAARMSDSSKRWRSWGDLTVGRLIAVRVRFQEYVLTLNSLAADNFAMLGPQTNRISLTPMQEMRGGQQSAVPLALAKRYLDRCMEDNRGTPWQFLAERELQDPAGLSINQSFVPPPQGVFVPTPTRPTPQIQLPRL